MYGAEYNTAWRGNCAARSTTTEPWRPTITASVDNIYAVGDVTPGHNQIPIALGDGAKAGISVNWNLRDFPRDPELVEEQGPVREEEVPGIPDELLEQAVSFHTYD